MCYVLNNTVNDGFKVHIASDLIESRQQSFYITFLLQDSGLI